MKMRHFFLPLVLLVLLQHASAANDGDEDNEGEEVLDSPIIAYAKVGNTKAINFLLENTQSKEERTNLLNTLDRKDRSALVWAMRRHRPETARFLLKEGIDVMHKDCQNHTSLWWAIHGHEWEIAADLVDKGVEVNSDHQHSYLYITAMYSGGPHKDGALILADKLIKAGADIDDRNVRGLRPLDIARKNRRHDMVRLLEKAIKERPHALHLAAEHSYTKLALDMVASGKYNFTEVNEAGETALQVSMKTGHHDLSKAIKGVLRKRKAAAAEADKNDEL